MFARLAEPWTEPTSFVPAIKTERHGRARDHGVQQTTEEWMRDAGRDRSTVTRPVPRALAAYSQLRRYFKAAGRKPQAGWPSFIIVSPARLIGTAQLPADSGSRNLLLLT